MSGEQADMVKELRDKTGCGLLEAKRALVACNWNPQLAIDWLKPNSDQQNISLKSGASQLLTPEQYGRVVENLKWILRQSDLRAEVFEREMKVLGDPAYRLQAVLNSNHWRDAQKRCEESLEVLGVKL